MGDHSAFFYGTLMVPEILYRVCYGTPHPTPFQTSHLTFQPALLPGFIRRKVRYCDYPGITPAEAPACVRGTYVYGLTDGDMWRLGIFEGPQYERRKTKVKLLTQKTDVGEGSKPYQGEGEQEQEKKEEAEAEKYDLLERKYNDADNEEVETNVFVFTAGETRLEDGEWNFEEFKRRKLKRWTGQNEEYEEVDEAVQEIEENPTTTIHEPTTTTNVTLLTVKQHDENPEEAQRNTILID